MRCMSTYIPNWPANGVNEGVTSAPRQDGRLKADVSVIADVVSQEIA